MAAASAREAAYQVLRDRIIHLSLKPGEVLNDKELAERMGVSRTPVREAMIILNLSHLVVVRPQSGTFVAPIDLNLVRMEQFSRYALEKEVALRACRQISPEEKDLYRENLHLYDFYTQQVQLPNREEKLLELDNDFHRIAFSINGKEQDYARMLSSLQHIERLRILSLMCVKEDQVYQDHQMIADAIMHGDEAQCSYWIERHMNRYQEHLNLVEEAFPGYFASEPQEATRDYYG